MPTRTHTWLFDLDDTLHHAHRHVFPVIDGEMTRWIADRLAVPAEEADWLRRHYWQRYGATLLGLIRHHPDIDPDAFLTAVHPLPRLLAPTHPAAGLKRTLARLPGRKVLYTNGPTYYGEAMLAALGISRHFVRVIGVDALDHLPKPFIRSYRRLCRQLRLQPRRCIMVEDSIANLRTAKRLGMKTVWLRRHRRGHAAADVLLSALHHLPLRRAWQ